MQEALIRVRAALPSPEKLNDTEAIERWIRHHTGQHHSEFSADELAALRLKCEEHRTACVQPGDVIALARAVPKPSPIVRDLLLGSSRAGNAPEVHVHVRHLQQLLDSLPAHEQAPVPAAA
jgi:hypothetical protein